METWPAIARMEWGECLVAATVPPPALAAEARRALGGTVPGWLRRLAPSPWVVRTFVRLQPKPVAHISMGLCNLVELVVSQDNSCRYCYGAQRAFLKMLGYREEYIARLERDFHVAELTPADRLALEFARKISRADPRPDRADFEELARAGFSRPGVAELAAVAAATLFSNRVATLLALPPETFESMVERRLFRLVRPVIAWRMRPKPRRPAPLPQPNDGPCAAVVAALDGSPCAAVVRRIIDDAWASEVLPRRTKALLLAVVAKALGCARSQSEAGVLLAREGLGARDVDEVLTNLASVKLDAREARLVPFARETIRCQPAAIQKRMREVVRGFSPEEIVETAGVLSLANALCRLSVLLDVC